MSVATERRPVLGDWVQTTTYGYVGRVYAIHHRCPETEEWLAGQMIPIPEELVDQPWCSVLVDGGGAVVVPISLCSVLDDHPKSIRHWYADLYFREEVGARSMRNAIQYLDLLSEVTSGRGSHQ